MATDRERAEEIALAYRGSSGLADAIASALAQARAEGLRQAAEAADIWFKGAPLCQTCDAYQIADRLRALAEGGE